MTWDYRVVNRDGEFGIYECYYDEGTLITEDPIEPYGETAEELFSDMLKQLEAFTKPTLHWEDF